MKNKKGLLMRYFVIVVVLIASLAILLGWTLNFNWFENIDREACQKSIVLRSTFNFGGFEIGKDTIPLNCRTEKICLTNSKDKCEEVFGKSSKENPVIDIKINDKEDALEVLSDSLYDCHVMVGEGKLNFLSHDFNSKTYGPICSRIVFTEELSDEIGDISYLSFYDHLADRKDSNGRSYLKVLYDVNSVSDARRVLGLTLEAMKEQEYFKESTANFKLDSVNDLKIESSVQYAVIPRLVEEGIWYKYVVPIGSAVGTFTLLALTPATFGTSAVLAAGVAGGTGYALWSQDSDFKNHGPDKKTYEYIPPGFFPYDLDILRDVVGITDFPFIP